MFAVQFDRFGPPDVLTLGPFPEPHAGPGEVRIAVRAAGVAPVDISIRSGGSPSAAKLALPHIPGVDAAGVVDEIGAGVADVALGDEVFGSVHIPRLGGASAEFAVLASWAAKPAGMPWEQAGAAGTSIETATRALELLGIREGKSSEGTTLLIDGATGGVGTTALQLAVARGARVIGTGSLENQAFVAELGGIPTTYGEGLADRIAALGPVDVALHTAGSVPALIAITGSPESVVTVADFGAPALGARLTIGELAGEPSGRHGLAEAATLFERGQFRVPLRQVFALADAAEAHALAERGPRRGKIALAVS